MALLLAAGMVIAGASMATAGPKGENHCNKNTPPGQACGGHGPHGN
jgi:hypothetical protein